MAPRKNYPLHLGNDSNDFAFISETMELRGRGATFYRSAGRELTQLLCSVKVKGIKTFLDEGKLREVVVSKAVVK